MPIDETVQEDETTPKRKRSRLPGILWPAGLIVVIVVLYRLADHLMWEAYRRNDPDVQAFAKLMMFVIGSAAILGFLGLVVEMSRARRSGVIAASYWFASALGIAAVIAGPVDPARNLAAGENACINNLRLIDSSKQQWAAEHYAGPHDVPSGSDLRPYLGCGANGDLPSCPSADSTNFETCYETGEIGDAPTCKIAPRIHVLP